MREILCTFAAIMSNQNTYLASKPRYEILDGLRGVAAMLMVFSDDYHSVLYALDGLRH